MANAAVRVDAEPDEAPLSGLHAMLARMSRQFNAIQINSVLNHPSVYRWVKGDSLGPLDMTSAVNDRGNVLLMGEHGGMFFHRHFEGFYEAHINVLPSGGGDWAALMAHACLHKMFTETDCVELSMRVPKGNIGARVLANLMGFTPEFTRPAEHHGWVLDGDPIAAEVTSLSIQAWMRKAPGLVERGMWAHRRLEEEYTRHGRKGSPSGDENHDRYVGMLVEMIFGGCPHKGVVLFNRWAVMAGYQMADIVSNSPFTIDVAGSTICFREDDFWVMSCR